MHPAPLQKRKHSSQKINDRPLNDFRKNSSPKPSKGGRVSTTRQPKSQTREKPKTSVLSYPGGTSTREKPRTSVLSYSGGTKASSQRGNGGYCMAGSSVWRCFCGISEDYRWHSLRGKGKLSVCLCVCVCSCVSVHCL